ncbi:hypothetical protein [Salinispira pacifica]|uniref:Uncharacterized protein n=1 Tax=Salinispira pacifica TaxID=1307761 RepID=V5WKU9_9SPIO|nr:hypothetical protein [Salinispira pacifica]AHC16452.1 hypothetical protein L21SP2_3110 [Salinispira pacifica]
MSRMSLKMKIITAVSGAVAAAIILTVLLVPSRFRVGAAGLPSEFTSVIETAMDSVVSGNMSLGENRADLHLTAPSPAIIPAAPMNAPAGEHLFAALDPMVWIHNENLIPRQPGGRVLEDYPLEEMADALTPFVSSEDRFYPVAIPGDYPELFLPVLVMLSESLQGFVNEEVFDSWDELLANPRTWRDSGYFDRAYELLDDWANRGIISPQWWDMDEPAYRDAALEGRAGLFPHYLSWKRLAPAEERFYWKVIPAVSGRGVRTIRPVTRAAVWSAGSRSTALIESSPSGSPSGSASPSPASTAGLLEKLPEKHRETASRLIRAVQGRTSRERIVTHTGWTPAISGSSVVNKEDRDARTMLASADFWIIVR